MVTASCGHQLTESEGMGIDVCTGGYDRTENTPVLIYSVVCTSCYSEYKKKGQLLDTKSKQNNWINKK